MALSSRSELLQFLTDQGIRPRKSLSQNFLTDGNILRKIVQLAEVTPGDTVLEIGPGPGALTECLLAAGAIVVAVEKDEKLAAALSRLQTSDKRLHIVAADCLEVNINTLMAPFLRPGRKAKVVANLPYQITTPIVTHLSPMHHLFSSIIVMVQEEVARRYVGKPGTKDYSAISVFLQFYTHPKYGFKVSRRCFLPAPKVDSAVIRLNPKEPPKVDEERFFQMVRRAFQQRRKMMRGSLRDLYPPTVVISALEAIGKKETARPEELSLDELLQLLSQLNAG